MIQGIDFSVPSLKEIYEKNKALTLENSSPQASFVDVLKQSIEKINQDFAQADQNVQEFMLGQGDIQDVLMSVQKVNMEFRLAVQIRNKLIEAYQEIMRMSI